MQSQSRKLWFVGSGAREISLYWHSRMVTSAITAQNFCSLQFNFWFNGIGVYQQSRFSSAGPAFVTSILDRSDQLLFLQLVNPASVETSRHSSEQEPVPRNENLNDERRNQSDYLCKTWLRHQRIGKVCSKRDICHPRWYFGSALTVQHTSHCSKGNQASIKR